MFYIIAIDAVPVSAVATQSIFSFWNQYNNQVKYLFNIIFV